VGAQPGVGHGVEALGTGSAHAVRRPDDDDLVLGLHAVEDTPRHRFDFFRSGNRAAAKLLYDQSHNFLLDCPSTRKISRAKVSFENGHSLQNLKK